MMSREDMFQRVEEINTAINILRSVRKDSIGLKLHHANGLRYLVSRLERITIELLVDEANKLKKEREASREKQK